MYLLLKLILLFRFTIINSKSLNLSTTLSTNINNSNYTNLYNSYNSYNSNNSTNSSDKTNSIISSCIAVGIIIIFFGLLIFCKCKHGNRCSIDTEICKR
jgi:hypothetical protein